MTLTLPPTDNQQIKLYQYIHTILFSKLQPTSLWHILFYNVSKKYMYYKLEPQSCFQCIKNRNDPKLPFVRSMAALTCTTPVLALCETVTLHPWDKGLHLPGSGLTGLYEMVMLHPWDKGLHLVPVTLLLWPDGPSFGRPSCLWPESTWVHQWWCASWWPVPCWSLCRGQWTSGHTSAPLSSGYGTACHGTEA